MAESSVTLPPEIRRSVIPITPFLDGYRPSAKERRILGVQSRSEVGWIVSESPRLVCPSFADVLVGSEPPQGLKALSEVVGVEEGFEVLSELLVGLVVIAPNGGFLEGAVHPLDLTVGPGMVRFGEAVLDTMLLAADAVEHVQPVAGRRAGTP